VGKPLLEAIEDTANLRAGGPTPEGTETLPEADLSKQNEESMRQLQQMMGGLGT